MSPVRSVLCLCLLGLLLLAGCADIHVDLDRDDGSPKALGLSPKDEAITVQWIEKHLMEEIEYD